MVSVAEVNPKPSGYLPLWLETSWAIKEASKDAGGLAYPFVPILKTAIPLTGMLLFLQGLFIVFKSIGGSDND